MAATKWWLFVILILVDGLISNTPLSAQAFTLDGYFKIIALASKKRDLWRKIFFGNDIGFVASPWIFKDREKPPFVPILKSFPRYPAEGHYWNERRPSDPGVTFPQFYSNLQLSHRLPPPPPVHHHLRRNHARVYRGRYPDTQQGYWGRRWYNLNPGG